MVRGPPRRCLEVLLSPCARTTILGPALRQEVLQRRHAEDQREVRVVSRCVAGCRQSEPVTGTGIQAGGGFGVAGDGRHARLAVQQRGMGVSLNGPIEDGVDWGHAPCPV